MEKSFLKYFLLTRFLDFARFNPAYPAVQRSSASCFFRAIRIDRIAMRQDKQGKLIDLGGLNSRLDDVMHADNADHIALFPKNGSYHHPAERISLHDFDRVPSQQVLGHENGRSSH